MAKVKVLIFSVIGFAFIAIFSFVYKFHKHPISNDPHDWSLFAEYFGGIIGTIIALGNLGIFIILTIKLSDIEGERHKRAMDTQKIILLSEMRNKEINDIDEKLDNFIKELTKFETGIGAEMLTAHMIMSLHSFKKNTTLFTKDQSIKQIDELKKVIEKLGPYFLKISKDSKSFNNEGFRSLLKEYIICKGEFIDSLQKNMLDELK